MKSYTYARRAGGRFGALHPVRGAEQATPAVFPQVSGALDWLLGGALGHMPQSEDAFQLSVFAPEAAQGLPVMVFLPGGAFVSGAGTVRWYDATQFAQQQQCVVVTVNYRVGLLAHAGAVGAGNLVSDDLLIALRWVRDHIAGHGGNADDVTLVGQSAGAFWAFALAQLPAAAGLFRRAALMSLAWEPPLGGAEAAKRQRIVDEALAGADPETVPVEDLLGAQAEVARAWAGRGLGLLPTADGQVPANLFDVQAAVGRLHVDELLLTHNADEAAAFLGPAPEAAFEETGLEGFLAAQFADPDASAGYLRAELTGASPKIRMIRAMTLHQIELYATELAEAAVAAGKSVTTVRFDVRSSLPNAGAAHCFELPFLFNNAGQWSDAPMLAGIQQQVFDSAAAELGAVVGSFVREGRPCTTSGTPVPRFLPHTESLYVIGANGTRQIEPERRHQALRPGVRV